MSFAFIICHHLPSFATICHHLPSFAIICPIICPIICHHLPSFATICVVICPYEIIFKVRPSSRNHTSQLFHYDSTSTSTCAALIGGGSSDAGGSDSVACTGTSTESASKVNNWQTVLTSSSTTSDISFSQHDHFKAMLPLSPSISLKPS